MSLQILLQSSLATTYTAGNDYSNVTDQQQEHQEEEEEETVRLNHIYPSVRIFALTLMALSVMVTLYCSFWFYTHRKDRIIMSHQPEFLLVICFGILLWEVSVIPYSIDDSICTTPRGCNLACLSSEWLYNIGFTISFAGLFSKLWRINKIFHNPQFKRIAVTVSDVAKPFAVIFTYTLTILLVWTIIDPPHWERLEIYRGSEGIYIFGSCQSTDTVGYLLEWLLFIGHIITFAATIRQAYLARNVSSDFSEAWPLALGLLNWIQLSVIGIPVLALIDFVAPSASYFLRVSIILAQSLTMLFAIFFPLYLHPSLRSPHVVLGATVRVTNQQHHHTVTGITNHESTIHQHDNNDSIIEQLDHMGTNHTGSTPDKCNGYENFHINDNYDDVSQQQQQQQQQQRQQQSGELRIPSTNEAVVTIPTNNESSSIAENERRNSNNNVKDTDDEVTIEC